MSITDVWAPVLLGLLFLGGPVLVWLTRPTSRKDERARRQQCRRGRFKDLYAFLDTRSGAAVGTVVFAGAGVYLVGLAVANLVELVASGD